MSDPSTRFSTACLVCAPLPTYHPPNPHQPRNPKSHPNQTKPNRTNLDPNPVLLKFVADAPEDLSSGTLYAAKLTGQRADAANRTTWDLGWIKLGTCAFRGGGCCWLLVAGCLAASCFAAPHPLPLNPPNSPPQTPTRAANQSSLEALIAADTKFSDIFEVAAPTGAPPTCPAGFKTSNYVNPAYLFTASDGKKYHIECLKVRAAADYGRPSHPAGHPASQLLNPVAFACDPTFLPPSSTRHNPSH
jgi:hypothetical protein